jgi:DNA polymerase III sliding clamp (beta) subunit (PCNA family)
MKLTIKTDKLKEMVTKSIKGASNNKMIPRTSLLVISLKDNVLTLMTTDSTNYLYVIENNVDGDDFYVVVPVEQFSKLISKLTCENVTLELHDSELEVVGNGKYKIELQLDETGEPAHLTSPLDTFSSDSVEYEIALETIKTILNTLKPALAGTSEFPCYMGYYVGNKVIATDTYKICSLDSKLFDSPILISSELMNLLDVITDKTVKISIKDNVIVIKSNDCIVYGILMEGIDDYAIDAINGLLDTEIDSMCKLPKNTLLQLIDRLALFVGTYDKNGIYLTFTENALEVSSKSSNGIETIDYIESDNFTEFTCCVDIEMLRALVKANTGETIELHYGNPICLKLTDDKITQIIALLEDDRSNN